ncbi:MAG: MGH1-like glycoside hydrolase domain-containing protein [Parachlamydiaceae bacterium]
MASPLGIETTAEGKRIDEIRLNDVAWRFWGPYLSERQWGTVREDYSAEGTAWEYLPHDQARSRAFRWGEEGIAGISDQKQILCFALSMWNGKDPFLKERLFGLTNAQGNHGEDVKEYYFYVDNVPTHSYMKHLYKYPQNAFPYDDLVKTNAERTREESEYELLDTGVFDENRYFDVFTEYVKSSPNDLLIRITVANRGPDEAAIDLLPTLFFRNTWSWQFGEQKPQITLVSDNKIQILKASHSELGDFWLYCDQADALLFTENETNARKLFQTENESAYVKDGISDAIVSGSQATVNPENKGTKAAAHYHLKIPTGKEAVIRLRLCNEGSIEQPFGKTFDQMFEQRKEEADAFYLKVTPYDLPEDMRRVQRQAFAGLLWNKQCYHYNVKKWLEGDPLQPPPPPERKTGRNSKWLELDAFDVFSMPDKWEYPWFAAWDLSFHAVTLAMIDPEFAKHQMLLLTREWYMSSDGQIPAYEWKFSDVNPPVQAWAAMRVYQIEREMYGREDRQFLERIFLKLVINFTWWVNRKDESGRNIFGGGFLGLDNIGAFNRSLAPRSGGALEQPDATGWMGMYCLNCLQIALELAEKNSTFEDIATKFFEHFVNIADAINNIEDNADGLWSKEEGFYYSVLLEPDGKIIKFFQESMIGIIPLFAVGTNNSDTAVEYPHYRKRFLWYIQNHKEMLEHIADLNLKGAQNRMLLAFANSTKLSRMMEKILDESQFLSPYGIRSVSKSLGENPFKITLGGKVFQLDYEPAESTTPLFGGNSNWRGPVWFPLNFLLIESLQKFHYYFDDNLKVECPAGSGKMANLWEVSAEISYRLIQIFLRNERGRRPVYGDIEKFQTDPLFGDYLLFHEYFNGDTGKGLGASQQTGWTALVAKLIHQYGKFTLQNVSPRLIESEKIGNL